MSYYSTAIQEVPYNEISMTIWTGRIYHGSLSNSWIVNHIQSQTKVLRCSIPQFWVRP